MADNESTKPTKLAAASRPDTALPSTTNIQRVMLEPPGSAVFTPDEALWGAIRNRTTAANFPYFERLVDLVFCKELEHDQISRLKDAHSRVEMRAARQQAQCYHGSDAYNLLKAVAEVFMALQCGVRVDPLFDPDGKLPGPDSPIPGEEDRGTELTTFRSLQRALETYLKPSTLPYLQRIIDALKLVETNSPLCDGLAQQRDCFPCMVELIWSYWHEEGMLVQSLNAICLRFQNTRSARLRDPLANFRLNPLRPLNTLIWGYIQDEINRLTVVRRSCEYEQEYGLRLMGRAIPNIESADSRSKFLEAFHNLLYVTSRFYKEADDTTVRADAFPVLNALRELHLILAQGAHNQFGDLPWTARVEMLIQKWLLARPEIREFLGGAPMVPYKESWMPHADAMKGLQGWSDVSVSHYRDLGVYGEQILLSVRYGDWIDDLVTHTNAYNWAISWRSEIQSYMHSYRAVTGVDLAAELTDSNSAAQRYVQPSVHQMRRLNQQAGRNGAVQIRRGAMYSR